MPKPQLCFIALLVILVAGCITGNKPIPASIPPRGDHSSEVSPLPLPTESPAPTLNLMEDEEHRIVAVSLVLEEETLALNMVDVDTGLSEELIRDAHYLTWTADGCGILIRRADSGNLEEIDTRGNVLREVSSLPRQYGETISPDLNWIAYLSVGGYQDYDHYEIQNVNVISVDGLSGPYTLTQNGGARQAAWSPDSQWIAYSDYDMDAVQQLFISHADGSNKRQLSAFTDSNLSIISYQWSPNGQAITFVQSSSNSSYLGIINLENQEITFYGFTAIGRFWWHSETTIIAQVIPQGVPIQHSADVAIVRIDTLTGRIHEILMAALLPQRNIWLPGPIDAETIGFFSSNNFYLLDLSTQQYSIAFNLDGEILAWSAAPPHMQEHNCPP